MIALDVSGSMSSALCAGSTTVNCREGSVAMAMATLHAEGEDKTHVYAFTTTCRSMNGRIRPGMTIGQAMLATNDVFGATDCAMPMTKAMKLGLEIDAFVVYTDSETYAPTIHPQVALEQYRKHTGIDAKLIVVGMASNCLSIADDKDSNTLNLAGFDTSTPNLITMFINGEL
jgi:60 kDa SS-A/Ro ribonucleoprotein